MGVGLNRLEDFELNLKDYGKLVRGKACRSCGHNLPARVKHYPHAGGWILAGHTERQWLYVHCSRCGYDNALWKLGIRGDVDHLPEAT